MRASSKYSRTFGIAIAAICALLFAMYGAAEGLIGEPQENSLFQYAASFACFGFIFGAILAFDTEPGDRHENRPGLRVLLSGVAGLAFSLVWKFPGEGIALSVLVASALGYFGLVWAKHI